MEFAIIGSLLFGAFVGYKVGFSRGEQVNRPVAEPAPREPYDERRDRR